MAYTGSWPADYLQPHSLPRIQTRLLLPEDAAAWTEFVADAECTRYFPDAFKSDPPRDAVAWINRGLERYAQQRYGMQALIHKETGAFLGMCGLLLQEVDGIAELEVGYHLFRQHWGQGYATEAARYFREWAQARPLADSIISIIHVDNLPSQAVARRHGLVQDKRTTWNEMDVLIFRTKTGLNG